MRVDRFLFRPGAKSRTLAQALIDTGRVRIDGKRATKPSEPVALGSILAFPLRGQVRIVRSPRTARHAAARPPRRRLLSR